MWLPDKLQLLLEVRLHLEVGCLLPRLAGTSQRVTVDEHKEHRVFLIRHRRCCVSSQDDESRWGHIPQGLVAILRLVPSGSSGFTSRILLRCRFLALWSARRHMAGNALEPERLPATLSWWCSKLVQVSSTPCWSTRWPSALHLGVDSAQLLLRPHLHQCQA